MAFKTDTLQLKEYGSDPAGTAGELAIVGSAGNRVLKLYDDGAWADVSANAGGGAAELNELSDVLSSPSTVNHIAFVEDDNGVAKLNFGYLNTEMINATALDIDTESSNTNATIMSSLAIKNKIEGYSYSRFSNFNHVQNTGWGQNLYVTVGTSAQNTLIDNFSWVNTVNPQGNSLVVHSPYAYAEFAKITIMNASVYQLTFTKDTNATPAMQFNCMQNNPPLSDDITLEAFQKAILIKTTGNANWDVIIASI